MSAKILKLLENLKREKGKMDFFLFLCNLIDV